MLVVGWGAFDLVLVGILIINHRKQIRKVAFRIEICKMVKEKWQYVVIALFVFGMLWAALKMIPYNWDSMTYHCARLFHWKQNQSIAHYTTSVTRQISSPVLAAFVNVNDGTNEGLKYTGKNIFTVQYHPEACPGPQDSGYLFDRFLKMMEVND